MLAHLVRRLGSLALLAAAAAPAAAQSIISGTVRGERNAPLGGAVVSILGTRVSAPTNDSGRYRLVLPAGQRDSITIVARRIAFEPQSRRVGVRDGATTMNFSLVAAPLVLSPVVATSSAKAITGTRPGSEPTRPMPIAPARMEARMADAAGASTSSAGRERSASAGRASSGRRAEHQAPNAGVLTAAVWDDAQHWTQYMRFLDRAQRQSWNPWGLEIGRPAVRPASGQSQRQRSSRRALDLGFLVDATGSMGDEMSFLQTELQDIVRRVRAVEPDLDIRVSVVFYRDRGDAFVTRSLPFTRQVDSAVTFIAGTTADGGGDYPEDMNAGLEAMMRQPWSRDAVPQMLFLLADAPPQRYPGADYTYHEAIQDAAAAGIAIYPVAASGTDKPTEFLFRAMAVMTGGKYVFLTDDSGVGNPHEEPDISGYTVERLNDLMVREIRSFVTARSNGPRVAGLR